MNDAWEVQRKGQRKTRGLKLSERAEGIKKKKNKSQESCKN